MKTFTINNCTKKDIVVDYRGKQQTISANSMQKIEAEETDTLRIFKAENNSSHLCIAKYFDNDSIRNILIKLVLLINFDLYIDIKNAPKRITINERYYHFYTIFIFSILQLNGNNKVSYEYHKNSDKKKLLFVSLVTMLSMAAVCVVMAVVSLFALFDDFSVFSVVITLITIGLVWLVVSFAKALSKFNRFNDNLSYTLKESKIANVYYDNGRVIKYRDASD